VVAIAYLGPPGTYAESAARTYQHWLATTRQQPADLHPYPSIARSLHAVAEGKAEIAIAPVENSTEGSVSTTLDTFWQLDGLQIQHSIVLKIAHRLLSRCHTLADMRVVYSHPQAIAQCQRWLETHLPSARLVPTASTVEALRHLETAPAAAAIASARAVELHDFPVLAANVNDYPDNCTRFWVVSQEPSRAGATISLAFSTAANVPGALVKPLSVFAERDLNMTRIESRPTKRSLGEYLFFIDLAGSMTDATVSAALTELAQHVEVLKIFGNYSPLVPPDRLHSD